MKCKGFGVLEIMAGVAILSVMTVAGVAVVSYNNTIKENAALKASLQTVQEAHDDQLAENFGLRQRADQLQSILKQRREVESAMVDMERRMNVKLEQLRRTDQKVREWADVPIPDSVLRGLRDDANRKSGPQDDTRKPTAKPTAAIPNPGLARADDELGVTGACENVQVACAAVQRRQGRIVCLGEG